MTKFLNTRILLSGATILAAAVLIIGATFAFFSDVETSEANAFTAGDVQIAIDALQHTYNGDKEGEQPLFTPTGFSFTLADLKPLDSGSVAYTLENQSNDATVCAMVEETGNAENIRNSSEEEAGDTTPGNPGIGAGELQNFMSFNFGGSQGLLSDIDGEWFNVGDVPSPGSEDFTIGYCFGEYDGATCLANETGDVNVAQTDGMTADISFYAVQTRNNETFNCEELNDGGTGGDEEVGAVLSAYEAPAETCTTTIAAGSSIQAAIDSANAGDKICLGDGDHNFDEYPLRLNKDDLTLAGVNGPLASAELDGGVIIDNDGVTVTGLIINDSTALSETFGVYVNTNVDDAEVSYNIIQGPGTTGRGVINATGTTTNLLVDNNQITGWLTGVFLNPSTGMEVSHNTITGNGVGSGNDNPTNNNIHHNVIKNNTVEGVGALVNAGESLHVNFNNIYSNGGAGDDLNNYGTDSVDAESNWWGDTDPSDNVNGDPSASGPVDFDPFAPSAYTEN